MPSEDYPGNRICRSRNIEPRMNYDRLECVTFYVIVQAKSNKDTVIGDGEERNTFENTFEKHCRGRFDNTVFLMESHSDR